MHSVLDRDALEGSPLADLHAIANQLGVDGFRRLRKADLVDAIVARQSGEEPTAVADAEVPPQAAAGGEPEGRDRGATGESDDETPKPRRRRSRSRRSGDPADETTAAVEAADKADEEEELEAPRSRSRRRGSERPGKADQATSDRGEGTADGVVELQPNGSAFLRADGTEDVYVSAAQVKRCELVSGDRVTGPVRAPRRSERYPSLIRVDTINGKSADEVAGEGAKGPRFEDRAAAFPTERLELTGEDATLNAVQWLTPFGKGSRVVVCGGPLSGKSDLLRRIAAALPSEGIEKSVVLAGARPEEAGEWGTDVSGVWLGASADAQAQAIEQAVELGRRIAARGDDAVVIIDSFDGIPDSVARRTLAAARNLVDGGSLTLIAAATTPIGGETTVIALDGALTGMRRFPNLDLTASGSMRPELLVGDAGADKIAAARAEARAATI